MLCCNVCFRVNFVFCPNYFQLDLKYNSVLKECPRATREGKEKEEDERKGETKKGKNKRGGGSVGGRGRLGEGSRAKEGWKCSCEKRVQLSIVSLFVLVFRVFLSRCVGCVFLFCVGIFCVLFVVCSFFVFAFLVCVRV